MALKRSFDFDRKPDQSKKTVSPSPADPANPTGSTPENIDAMVSEFLAELRDISSEIGDLRPTPSPEEISRPKESARQSVSDLREIENEIEQSLSELERLKNIRVVPEEQPGQASEPTPVAYSASIEPEQDRESVDSEAVQELPAGNLNMFELYRNSLSSPTQQSFWRRRGLFIGSTATVLILIFALLYFWQKPAAVDQMPDQSSAPFVPAQETAPTPSAPATPPAGEPESTPVTEAAKLAASTVANPDFNNSRSTPRPARSSERPVTETAAVIPQPEAGAALEAAIQRQPNVPLPSVPSPSISTSAVITQMRPAPPSPTVVETESAPVSVSAPVRKQEPPPAASQQTISASARSRPVVAQPIQRVSPVYPRIARLQKVSGVVEVEADVNEKGDVVRAKALSGPVLLRAAAEEALMKWKFRPASLNGTNVSSKARVKMTFSIK